MPEYVDGFLLPLPTRNLPAYRKMAAKASRIWKEYGALDYRECVLDDKEAGGMVPFSKSAAAKKGETVVMAWIVYKSRAHRDSVNAKIMKDPRIAAMMEGKKPPFDCKKMAYGGFKTLVSA